LINNKFWVYAHNDLRNVQYKAHHVKYIERFICFLRKAIQKTNDNDEMYGRLNVFRVCTKAI